MRFQSQLPIGSAQQGEPTFSGAKILAAAYLTELAAVEEALPRDFEPADQPLVSVFVAHYPKTNFGSEYREAALLVSCRYKETLGSLCFGIVVDDDVALILGREIFGFPKKMARISLEEAGDNITGRAERRGTEFLTIDAKLGPEADIPSMPQAGPTFLVKAFPAAELNGLEWPPKVVSTGIGSSVTSFRPALSCDVSIRESELDRWAAFPVKDVLFGGYVTTDLTMSPGVVLGELDPADWLPYIATNLR
jgi:acetoacetate decarboxylase